jgi:hypothetical protein
MTENYLIAKHARLTICIVRPPLFITSVVDERRALVLQLDDAIAESDSRVAEAIACIGILGAFVVLFACLVFIFLEV